MQRYQGLVSDGAVWPNLIVVSTPSLHFLPCVVKTHESVRVQTFGSEPAVEAFNEAVVGRLARPGEVENAVLLIGSEIKIAGDELRTLIDPDRLRIAHNEWQELESRRNHQIGG